MFIFIVKPMFLAGDNKNILSGPAQSTTNQNSCLGYQNINSANKIDMNTYADHRKVSQALMTTLC